MTREQAEKATNLLSLIKGKENYKAQLEQNIRYIQRDIETLNKNLSNLYTELESL